MKYEIKSSENSIHIKVHKMIPPGLKGGKGRCWTAIGRSDRQLCYYTRTENVKHFE
jgi:hypothetical protein